MINKIKNPKILLPLIGAVGLVLATSAFFVLDLGEKQTPTNNERPQEKENELSEAAGLEKDPHKCEENSEPLFSADITAISKIVLVVPPGTTQSSGFKTHSYIQTKERVPVYSPYDAVLEEGAFYTEEGMNQYSLTFRATCQVRFMVDHFQEPVQTIRDAMPDTPAQDTRTTPAKNRVSFKAGELLGYLTGTKGGVWDFGVYNSSKPNYLANDPQYNFSWKYTEAACPYDYYPTDKKVRYYSLFSNFGKPIPTTFCKN